MDLWTIHTSQDNPLHYNLSGPQIATTPTAPTAVPPQPVLLGPLRLFLVPMARHSCHSTPMVRGPHTVPVYSSRVWRFETDNIKVLNYNLALARRV